MANYQVNDIIVETLITARREAKIYCNFQLANKIEQLLNEYNITLKYTKEGTTWTRPK